MYRRSTSLFARTGLFILPALLFTAAPSYAAGPAVHDAPPVVEFARSSPLSIVPLPARGGDLAGFQVVNRANGAVVRAYYEPAAQEIAEQHLPYLQWMVAQVAALSQTEAGDIPWFAVVFTSQKDYIPPRNIAESRWTIPTDGQGALTENGEKMLFETMPHEQVHAVQMAKREQLPRWFAEGQASWAGLQVTAKIRPDMATKGREDKVAEAKALKDSPRLGEWGGMKIKQEAFFRQMSAEDRAKMTKDKNFQPVGAFKFLPSDIISDESNTTARYGAALLLFEELDAKVGREAVNNWVRAVWKRSAKDKAVVQKLAKEHLGTDLADRLK